MKSASSTTFKRLSLIVCLMGLIALCLGFGLSTQTPLIETSAQLRLGGLVFAAIGGLGLLIAAAPHLYGFSRTRRARYGANALVLTLSALGVIGLVNYLVFRHDLKWDLTENQTFSISPLTEKILAGLPKDIKVLAFFGASSRDRQTILNRLETYRDKSGGKLSFEMVDPNLQPGMAIKYGVKSPGTLIFESGTSRKQVMAIDEEQLTSAVLAVTQAQRHVYFLTGHNEADPEGFDPRGMSNLKQQLEQENFLVAKLSLSAVGKIPADASVLVIAGPDRALTPPEISQVKDYLTRRHGKLLLLLPPGVKTGLEPQLQTYGLRIGNNIVVDPGLNIQRDVTTPAFNLFTSHPITQDFNGGVFVFLPLARSVELSAPPKQVQGTELMKTTPLSWGETNLKDQAEVKKDAADRPGPLSVAVALTVEDAKPPADGEPVARTRLVVVGNAGFARNQFSAISANGNFFLNAVAWLDEANYLISLRPKPTTDRTLILTGPQASVVFWLSLAIVPGLIGLLGLVIWWRRR